VATVDRFPLHVHSVLYLFATRQYSVYTTSRKWQLLYLHLYLLNCFFSETTTNNSFNSSRKQWKHVQVLVYGNNCSPNRSRIPWLSKPWNLAGSKPMTGVNVNADVECSPDQSPQIHLYFRPPFVYQPRLTYPQNMQWNTYSTNISIVSDAIQ